MDIVVKKFIVCLSEEERSILEGVVKKLKGSSQKVLRAQVMLKADVNGAGWIDKKIAEAFDCTIKTVENIRERLVVEGFEIALNEKKPVKSPRAKILSGEQEAQLIAMRLGSPPAGYGSWTLRLLQNQMIELAITDSISYETVRKTLKKTT